MGWRLHGCYLFIRTLSFLASHVVWVFALLSQCAYYQLWKSYDILWLWVYILSTCAIPRIRYDNLILQCASLWKRSCVDGELCRYALKAQDREIDEEEERSQKWTNAFDVGVTLLRARVSAALLIGNIHTRFSSSPSSSSGSTIGGTSTWYPKSHVAFVDWMVFQFTLWIDLSLFWLMILFMWCKLGWLCCRLGCWRYYVWCAVVVAVGVVLMEVPMQYAFKNMDPTWCNLTLRREHDDDDDIDKQVRLHVSPATRNTPAIWTTTTTVRRSG